MKMCFSVVLLIALICLQSSLAMEKRDSLASSISKQEVTESRFLAELSSLKTKFELLNSNVDSVITENRMLKSKLENIEKELEVLKSPKTLPFHHNDTDTRYGFRRVVPYHVSTPQVAFNARVTQKLSNVGPGQIIRYDEAQLNIGHDYNPTTGVFTCDIPGLYVFHLVTTIYEDKYLELYILKNGGTVHNFEFGNQHYYGSGSTMTLIQLDVDDTVFVKADPYHSTGDIIFPYYSYFSGFLLYPRT